MSLADSATLSRTQIATPIRALTIDVRGRRSERRLGVLALLAVTAAGALLPLPFLAAMSFVILTCSVVVTGLWWHGWLGRARRLTQISWLADGRWLLTDGSNENVAASLAADCRVGSRWLWLRWRTDNPTRGPRGRSMLILPGDLAALDLRRLGVRLRLESVSRQPAHAQGAGA